VLINFFKKLVPACLPEDIEEVALDLGHSDNKEECLRKTYDLLTKKYRGYRVKTYLRIFELFTNDLEKIWKKNGFLHCTNLNYLMRVLLVKSGCFKDGDVRQRWTTVWFLSPHQYLRVKLGENEFVNIDLWSHAYGIPFGKYAHGFNT